MNDGEKYHFDKKRELAELKSFVYSHNPIHTPIEKKKKKKKTEETNIEK
jgi:hypothetical protein